MDEKAKLLDTLFCCDRERHLNIKFFRGDQVDLSEEEFCREVNRALAQVDDGTVPAMRRFPDQDRLVDVTEFVRAL
jgi:hypothetical protein